MVLLVGALVAPLACVPAIQERCRLVTDPTSPPALPAGFAQLDALLLRRAMDMTLVARGLNRSMVIVFHRGFAEQLLPLLCDRLEQVRALAAAGRTAEAGRKYQALLVATQVLAYAVAIQSEAQDADARQQAGGHVTRTLQKFASEAAPILEAALSEDPREIERALEAHPEAFAGWSRLLEEWPAQIDGATHQVEVAKVVWDVAFLVVATYEAAGAAAEIAASGRPPIPPLPELVTGGGAAMAGVSGVAALELAETLRKLIALGALDAGVVAALSRTLSGRGAPTPSPSAFSMSAAPGEAAGKATPSRPAPMQMEVERGQAPRDIARVDKPHVPGQQSHVHYTDGTSSNQDGSVHDAHRGAPHPTQEAVKWLIKHGWAPPP